MDAKGQVAQVHARTRQAAGVYAQEAAPAGKEEEKEEEKASDALDPLELTMRDISKSFLGSSSQHDSSGKGMQAITK